MSEKRTVIIVGEAFNDGKICDWFEQGISSCFLNGSRCDCPFSKRGCEIQCERIFKKEPEGEGANRYKSDKELNPNKPLTRSDVFKRLKIKEGEHIAEWFIPYSQIDAMMVAPSDQIKYGVEMVQKKFDDSEFYLRFLRIYHNVKIGNQVGIYIIGTD